MVFGLQQSFVSFATSFGRYHHYLDTPSSVFQSSVTPLGRPWSPGNDDSLFAMAASPSDFADYSQAAVSFFTSIRVPASLIAGNAITAFFVLTKRTQAPENESSKLSIFVLFLYQALSMASLLLSFNTIVTTTNAANSLMVRPQNPMAHSAYEFLMREMPYEFLSTKWAFYSSIFCFLGSVACRALLDFNLLKRKRIRSALMVLFSMGGLTSNMLHMVNASVSHTEYCNFWAMTVGVMQLFWERICKKKGLVLVSSLMWNVAAFITFLSLIPRMFHYTDIKESDMMIAPDGIKTNKKWRKPIGD
ncbi:hypothetical protein IV203_022512 [Nitzschia inconspicua]|uniref:Uncharacterized protein n=1 Tax=Nitzschia inconspicua TaxID=303405 RepID=A0A9K3PGW0_9STRA|nr:hypothetical protein IV203_022512 [Nitzschia inconspicua]